MHDLPAASPDILDTDALVALAAVMGHDPDHVRGLLETRRYAGTADVPAVAAERATTSLRIVIVHRRDAVTVTLAGNLEWSVAQPARQGGEMDRPCTLTADQAGGIAAAWCLAVSS